MFHKLLSRKILKKEIFYKPFETFNLGTHLNFFRRATSSSSEIELKLDNETIRLLEKLSLVHFENQNYVSVVEEAIKFAHCINSVNTDNVDPLISILEDQNLRLRDDIVNDGNCLEEILRNCAVVEEGYFVAPPGNIPVNLKSDKDTL